MKIVKLSSENVKRLKAVAVEPGESSVVTVGGRNDQGKSSVLDSIAYALGGERLIPAEPIRNGETDAKIDVDLGEYVVERRFRRKKIHTCPWALDQTYVDPHDLAGPTAAHEHDEDCQFRWSEMTSTLAVKSKDGARYPSPQALLDKLVGALTFDPLAFARAKPAEQRTTLAGVVGLDLSDLERRRDAAARERAERKQVVAVLDARVASMKRWPETPAEPLPYSAVKDAIAAAAAEKRKADDLADDASDKKAKAMWEKLTLHTANERISAINDHIQALDRERAAILPSLPSLADNAQKAADAFDVARRAADEALGAVPSVDDLNAEIARITATNRQVADNQAYETAVADAAAGRVLAAQSNDVVAKIAAEKVSRLVSVSFPISGLGLTDDGVTFDGLPFEQASQSKRILVSAAVGLAINPTIKVLLIRDGSLLDAASLASLAEWAGTNGAQVWIERVTTDADGVAVFIEDGEAR